MSADHKVCIIMLGETGVGKTSLMLRFCKNIFKEAQKCTLIVDSYNKTIILNDKKIALELWDTAGQERYKAIVKEYFRKADGVLLAYDMTNLTTFMKLSSWLSELRVLNEEATVFIVGNKSDLPHQNEVSRTTVEKYAREEGLDFCETSAKNNENVDEVFQNLALKVLERKKIAPFYKEIPNGEIKAGSSSSEIPNGEIKAGSSSSEIPNGEIKAGSSSSATSDSSQQQTESSLPPIIRFEDDFGNNGHAIKLTIEKPKEKKKKSCC